MKLEDLLTLVPKQNLDAVELLSAGFKERDLLDVGYTDREVEAASSTLASASASTDSKGTATTKNAIVAVVVILVLVVGAIALFVVMKRRKADDTPVVAFENPMYDTQGSSNPMFAANGNTGYMDVPAGPATGNGNTGYMDVPAAPYAAAAASQEASYMDVNPLYSDGGDGAQQPAGYMDVSPNTGFENHMSFEKEIGGFGDQNNTEALSDGENGLPSGAALEY